MVLALNVSRDIQQLLLEAALPLAASANPFLGSALSRDASGNVLELVAGMPLAGFASRQVETRFAPTAAGGPSVEGGANVDVDRGIFLAVLPVAGVAADDVFHQRNVYASDDGTFGFLPDGNTLVGSVVGIHSSGNAIVVCWTEGFRPSPILGHRTLAATGTETLTTADVGKLILCANTAGKTINLPPAADWAGKTIRFKKTGGGAFAITLDPDGAETIDGAATYAAMDADQDACEIYSTGTVVLIIDKSVA